MPVIVSVNNEDFDLFNAEFKERDFRLIKDQEIENCKIENKWIYQQIIKSQLHKLNICENYVCLDSDSYLSKIFTLMTFMYSENIPYTVIHEQKDLSLGAVITLKRWEKSKRRILK